MPIGFPESKSGAEIRILKQLFSPDEAKIALELSALPEPIEKIHKRLKKTGISKEELEKKLDTLVMKGSIIGNHSVDQQINGKLYGKVPLAIGMYELQGGRITKELEQDMSEYMEEMFYKEFHSKKTSQMRTVPINTSVTSDKFIDSYDNVRDIILNTEEAIAVGPCVCRTGRDQVDESCSCSDIRDTCLFIGNSAQLLLDLGHARMITKDETFKILDDAEKHGFVLQPENAGNPTFICCCCSCCCHMLSGLKMFPNPSEYFHSNYQAVVNAADCTECENCVDVCPMEALSIVNEVSTVDLNRCIGCGVCVTDCTGSAIMLKAKDKKHVPPETRDDLYKKIMVERFGMMGMLKMMPKMLLGRKI